MFFLYQSKTGKELYDSLDDIRRAGLLNIAAKTLTTLLVNGRSIFSYVQRLIRLRGDRFFVHVSRDLCEETKNSAAGGLFEVVSGALHKLPSTFSSFIAAGSFKTDDLYGNLQLTFFTKEEEAVADIDIDEANGLGHIFQVLRNVLSGRPTHPYDIHEILVYHQKLDPGYRFLV